MIGSKISWILGLTVSLLIGHIISYLVVKHLRVKINRWVDDEGLRYTRFTSLLGILERLLYTICIVFDVKFLIGVWLAIKMAGRWAPRDSLWGEYSREDDLAQRARGAIAVLLIGNLLSLLFGIAGGVIIKEFPCW
jgi:hypothetical protein